MRTKTLLLTAVLGAAGVVSSMAQVYSVNAVGYVNVDLPTGGFSLLANPLSNGGNKLSEVIPTAPDGATVYMWTGSGFDTDPPAYIEGAGWQGAGGPAGDRVVAPGQGWFLFLQPGAGTVKLTFVGEVKQGDNLTQPIPVNYSIQASQVPQAGLLSTDLSFDAVDGDTVYQWDATKQAYDNDPPQFVEGAGWNGAGGPKEPNIRVAESFFVFRTGAAGAWVRTFHVN